MSIPIQDSVKNAMLASGVPLCVKSNTPKQYADRQEQYYEYETSTFVEEIAKYSSDFVKAQVQGIDSNDPWQYTDCYLRMTDMGYPTITSSRKQDDYKMVLVADKRVDYLRPGAKIKTMGSTWLVINPNNVSGVGAGGEVQRCNAVWNHLDWYGNVISEPLAVDRYLARANNTDHQEAVNLPQGYFDVKCQLNPETAELGENSRIILGRNCYRITGFSDFTQEFTGDYDSVRMLEFSIHFEEPNREIDDMERHVAGGLNFSWQSLMRGQANITVGETAQFAVRSLRCGQQVQSTKNKPIYYGWCSSNERVATVTQSGLVTALSAGECTITATLQQNPSIAAKMTVTITDEPVSSTVKIITEVPSSIELMESATVAASVLGGKGQEVVEWAFSGAEQECYGTDINGNTVIVTCWSGSVTPLTVTASYGGTSASVSLNLEGI